MVDETLLFYRCSHQERSQHIMMLDNILHVRPQSVINIVEIPDASEANPQPDNDGEKALGEFISAQKLKEIGGVTHLFDLHELTVKVDTTETSIGNVGSMAPNLKKLNLNNSFITCVRDLGTSLNNLTTLWLSRCCLQELDGISCIGTLKELFLAYNEIFDLSPLCMLENLEVLDLEGNDVDDLTQLEFLTLCSKLRVLTMKGNPLEHSPTPSTDPKDLKFYSYRDAVLSCLPELTMLDEEKFLEEIIDGKKVRRNNPNSPKLKDEEYADDYGIIRDSLKAMETTHPEEEEGEESLTSRPLSARLRCQSSRSSKSSHYGDSKSPKLLTTPEDVEESLFELSNLTHGGILCGNPVQALRRRKDGKQQKIVSKNVTKKKPASIFTPEHSYLTVEEDAIEKDDVLEELKLWRHRNRSLFENEMDLSLTVKDVNNNDCSGGSDRKNGNNFNSRTCSGYSPSPPSAPKPSMTSSRTRRSLGAERPSTLPNRPNTAADFRSTTGVESDLVVSELEVIDENAASSCRAPYAPYVRDETSLARPSTARAALRTSKQIENHDMKDET